MAVPIVNIMEPADWQDREMERLEAENAELRELVRRLVYATHPADRATLVANAAELGVVE